MATAFKIEKDVPAPTAGGPRGVYPFAEMDVGDSFLAPLSGNVRGAAYAYGSRHGKKFTTSEVEGGFRVWRIA